MADDVVRDIPEEMVEAAARQLVTPGLWDRPDDTDQDAARAWARQILSAALAGRTVVLLPEDAFDHIQDEIIRVGSGREANAVMALLMSWRAGSGVGDQDG